MRDNFSKKLNKVSQQSSLRGFVENLFNSLDAKETFKKLDDLTRGFGKKILMASLLLTTVSYADISISGDTRFSIHSGELFGKFNGKSYRVKGIDGDLKIPENSTLLIQGTSLYINGKEYSLSIPEKSSSSQNYIEAKEMAISHLA